MFELLSNYALFSLSTVMGAFAALATLLHLQFGLNGIVNFGIVGFWGLGMYTFGIFVDPVRSPIPVSDGAVGRDRGCRFTDHRWVIVDLSDQAVLVATLAFRHDRGRFGDEEKG